MAAAQSQTFDIFMSKFSIWKAYKSGLGLKFGTKPNSHQLIIQEVFFHTFSGRNWEKPSDKEEMKSGANRNLWIFYKIWFQKLRF